MFKSVNSNVDVQAVEQDQLTFWRMNRIFERTMSEREGGTPYVFYEGPPTANGLPGSHHVLARAFKDMFPRYKTMQGFYSLRRGGWDTHGLPVEIAVQKELGLTSKQEIEAYGVAEFNEKCRASVFRHITEWEKLTERIAFWVDLDNAYVTFTNDYIESVWWILKQFWEKDLLFRGDKVVPYSPTSGTPLSSHEVSLGYQDIDDPSVYVRFPLRDKQGVYFLAWTTTPWTLPGNVALAVGADVDYVQVEIPLPDGEGAGTEQLILAAELVEKVLGADEDGTRKIVRRYKGKDLAGWHYNPLYTFLPVAQDYAYVVTGDFVSTADGTGIVHQAPAYGADDMAMAEKYSLPILRTVVEDGRFIDAVTPFRGMWFKDADKHIIRDLKARGLMYRSETYRHSYPHNWRDGTPLMYYARPTWFIRATEYRDKLVALNQTINWVPNNVKDGRFGNWLDDLKDWALGRERYWGTPLPVWVDDENGDMLCVGSVAELNQLTGQDLTEVDLHRPYVDEITFPNPNGGGTMRRVPEVIDVWFDSGAMPYAQWGYPRSNQAEFAAQYPADYICEAVDQTRGWFYSLHAISGMLNEQVAFKNVICLGHILDDKGEKMSKSKGNIVDPWDVLGTHGADAFRWYMYTSNAPGEQRRFSGDLVGEVIKKFWLTLWNTYSFFVTYANIDGWTPDSEQPPVSERDELDRWIIAELHQLTQQVTEAYESYDATSATRPVQAFVDVLSNWYVRLSRRRFWKSESDSDKLAAYATLYECLVTVSKLVAPTMPFVSEALYRNLVAEVDEAAPPSVHLARWPEYDASLIAADRINEMRLVQRLVSLGRSAREKVKIGVRQPLAEAQFVTRDEAEIPALEKMSDMIGQELNVKKVTLLGEPDYKLNPLPNLLGRKFGKTFPRIQKLLREGEQADVQRWAKQLLAGEMLQLEIDGETFEVTPEECEVQMKAGDDAAFAEENGYMAVLDTALTDDLIKEGLAREVVRRVQSMRRDADFNIADHITLRYKASDKLAEAITQFADYIRAETLTDTLETGEPDAADEANEADEADEADNGFFSREFALDDETLSVGVKRISD
jgi:isoleucyl-tRNA synthetase